MREISAKVYVTAFDGFEAVWGEQVDVRDLGVLGAENNHADESAANTVRYISKVIGYMAKDLLGHVTEHGERGAALATHLGTCEDAAQEVRCSPKRSQGLACTCPPTSQAESQTEDFANIVLSNLALSEWLSELPKRDMECPVHSQICKSARHTNLGASAHTVTVSRNTEKRQGWSLSGYTRAEFQPSRETYAEERARIQANPDWLATRLGIEKPRNARYEFSEESVQAALRTHRRTISHGVSN